MQVLLQHYDVQEDTSSGFPPNCSNPLKGGGIAGAYAPAQFLLVRHFSFARGAIHDVL